MGKTRVPGVLGRLVLALTAGACLVLAGPGAARATSTVEIPAPTDYDPTPGCGGFKLDVVLHNVRNQPGYLAGLTSVGGRFAAYADTARTFGCLRPDGTFDHGRSFVVRTTRQQLLDNYFYPDSNYILSWDRNHDSDEGPEFYMNFPKFYMNFPPVQVSSGDTDRRG
ncbi:hypothetical protein HEP87_47935 [Streptomyces sp. S1D4-11]|nr:hypothetical protein [Streptomyces sp. S1D4-11]QIZ00169.1 hypothetical protein HEP87_47935 [Streptomyces sp. S1D4-11]